MTEQEKKKRISELRAELRELQAEPRSDWHTAFEAFLHFKTHKYKGVSIRTEVEIGADAPRTDYVILTEEETQEFEESIFKIFRKINIIEYKNPHDALNERIIHKIAGYAHLLIGTAEHEGDVPPDEVTVSIFRAVKNPGLFKSLESSGNLIRSETAGIYRVMGVTGLPFQIVITSELEGDKYADCRALTDKAAQIDIETVIKEFQDETDDMMREYYGRFLNLIAEKNPDTFSEIRRESDMKYPALMKVFEEDVNKIVDERVNEKLNENTIATEQETLVTSIVNLMDSTKWNAEKAMETLKIPQNRREAYMKLVEKRM